MTNFFWLPIALISACLAATVNYTDKYLVDRVMKGRSIGALVLFTALAGIPTAGLIWLFDRGVFAISGQSALILLVNGGVYVAWLVPYLYALQRDDTSSVVPLFQLTPIISAILGLVFLGEALAFSQWLGIGLIVIGAGLLTFHGSRKSLAVKGEVLVLMTMACVIIATSALVFKRVALEVPFWTASFWEYLGFGLAAVVVSIVVAPWRRAFFKVLYRKSLQVLPIALGNELIAMAARITYGYATLLAPLGIVTAVAEGSQPIFALLLGAVVSVLAPKLLKEDLGEGGLVRKIMAITIIFGGGLLLAIAR